jgi:hypothetical protein
MCRSAPTYQTVPEPDAHSDDEGVPEELSDLTPRLQPDFLLIGPSYPPHRLCLLVLPPSLLHQRAAE